MEFTGSDIKYAQENPQSANHQQDRQIYNTESAASLFPKLVNHSPLIAIANTNGNKVSHKERYSVLKQNHTWFPKNRRLLYPLLLNFLYQ